MTHIFYQIASLSANCSKRSRKQEILQCSTLRCNVCIRAQYGKDIQGRDFEAGSNKYLSDMFSSTPCIVQSYSE